MLRMIEVTIIRVKFIKLSKKKCVQTKCVTKFSDLYEGGGKF